MNDWIAGNRFLNMEEMTNNAYIIGQILIDADWSPYSVSALLGNMQEESSINPAIWENLDPFAGGYGLTQWTPYTKFSEWAGDDWETNYYKEVERIDYERENNLQWFRNPLAPIIDPPVSFTEWAYNTDELDIETLTNYFLWFYEHPGQTIQPERAEYAQYWYDNVVQYIKKRLPVWLLFKLKERRK